MENKPLSGWLIASDIDGTLNTKVRTLPKRNGFDSNTNIKMSIANYSLEIPSYLKEDLSQRRDDDNTQQFVANTEDENSLARLSCTAIDDPGLEIYTQLLSNKEAFIRSFVKEIDGGLKFQSFHNFCEILFDEISFKNDTSHPINNIYNIYNFIRVIVDNSNTKLTYMVDDSHIVL